MKLNCCLLATTAVAQFDYNPNAEYDTDYNPDNSIARGQKFIRPTGDVNQFGITNALSDQLSSLAGDDASDIDFSALAALLLERGNGPRPARTTTTEAPTTKKLIPTTTPKPKKQFEKTNNKKPADINVIRAQGKRAKKPQATKKPVKPKTTARPKPTQPMRQAFRADISAKATSDVRGHKGFSAVQKMKFRAAAIQFAEKLQAYRATNRGAVFDEVGSGEGAESNSLLRTSMGNNNFGFYDYYDGDNFNAFYDYAEELIEEGAVGKNIDWTTELGKLNEQVGENRAPIQCWTCKRTYWDQNSTGDLWADCRTHGTLVTCPNQHLEDTGAAHYSAPVSCQITEHKFFGVTSELEVGCKQTRACQNNFEQNRMAGSVYGRTCRVESTFGTSKCRQCCSTNACYDGTTNTMDQSSFDQDSEWFDTTNHATYNTSG